jgi:hypothetical protein
MRRFFLHRSFASTVLFDDDWHVIPWDSPRRRDASLFCRSGLAQMPLAQWLPMLAELDGYAK